MHFSWFSFKSGKRVILLLITVFFTLLINITYAETNPSLKPYINALKFSIEKDLKGKVPRKYIEKIFSSPKLEFMPELMIKRLTWNEKELPYYQFLEKDRILQAFKFLQKHITLLNRLEKTFGVEKEVITAIFLIETNLGNNTGKFPTFNVLFSLALSGHIKLLKNVSKNAGISLKSKKVRIFIKRRSRWAYRELLYFIKIAYKNRWDPFSIKGSLFGAFGYPQFVPKSYLIYGYDWNKDGVVDLYSVPDALASIANYLKKEGYRITANKKIKEKIIMRYNISKPYAETVLAVAEKLKNLERNQFKEE